MSQSYVSRLRLTRWLPDLIVIGVPLFFYGLTLAPTIFAVDSAELTTGAYTLGIIHPPGYPTYLLLGHLFLQLPFGTADPGWRLNLMTAVTSALTAWLAYRIIRRLVAHPINALLAALIGALSFYIWGESNVAEVYSLNWLLVLLGFLLLLKWIESGRKRWLYSCALIGGLSVTHHLSAALAFPGYAMLIFFNSRRRPALSTLILAVLVFGLGLTPYLYLPLRYAANPGIDYAHKYLQADLSTPAGIAWYISGGPFKSLLRLMPIETQLSEAGAFLKYVLYNYLVIGCAVSVIGAIELWRANRSFLVATASTLAVTAIFYFNYEVFDKYTMYGVCLWLMAIWIGPGLDMIARRWSRRLSVAVALGLLALQVIVFYPQSDMRQFTSIRANQLVRLEQLPDRAVYFGDWETVVVSEYLQLIEQRRPDVLILNLPFMAASQAEAYAAQLKDSDRPRCFSRFLADQARSNGALITQLSSDCYQLHWP